MCVQRRQTSACTSRVVLSKSSISAVCIAKCPHFSQEEIKALIFCAHKAYVFIESFDNTRVIFYVRRSGLYLYKYGIYGTISMYILKSSFCLSPDINFT